MTYSVAVVPWIEQIHMPLQNHLQFLRRVLEELQNFNNTAHKISPSNWIQQPITYLSSSSTMAVAKR